MEIHRRLGGDWVREWGLGMRLGVVGVSRIWWGDWVVVDGGGVELRDGR